MAIYTNPFIMNLSCCFNISFRQRNQIFSIFRISSFKNIFSFFIRRFQEIDQRFEAIDQRFQEIDQRLDKLDYKSDTYEKASEKVLRLATTFIIAAATVAVLPSAFQAIGPLLTQIIAAGNN
ncbi:hypothetical protein MiYa_01120 [Microcystis aeruginosa NIES-2519]|uniref:Uncharacterized protein n=1 Tax=Microcystis aeruginosa NIES-2519 TaxID=2303981 RepID=A0A5A5R8Q1_MICAE|nr:hypothetical protein [Microcystis aeruginosa]GCA69592.1 hypothetical protein MiYa_01120 [Microcystis aeruginosa NIES-2519]GCA85771.1 hypothetical protein MiHa_03755 [Microcystis aeruginosa NIES-2522]